MRSIVMSILLLSVLVAAVSGNSDCAKAIQSLELTLEKKFDQLKAEIKESCCQGNTTGSSFLVILFPIFSYKSIQFIKLYLFFLGQVIHILRARKSTIITSG